MTGAGAWTACSTSGSTTARTEVDPGPTFGVEVTIAIKGRGRVVSTPAVINCPSHCFARLVLPDPKADGAGEGLALTAEAIPGSEFAGWSYDLIKVGARARGPSQCSPMTRMTSAPPVVVGSPRVALHYGETAGTPPIGLEAECADFLNVPVAYALTATFVDVDSGVLPAVDAGIVQLFEPPRDNGVIGRELGVAGGNVYLRFDENNLSGIAFGPTTGAFAGREEGQADAGPSTVIVDPRITGDAVTAFDVDRHVVFQNARGEFRSIRAGEQSSTLHYSTGSPTSCPYLASNAKFAYCRYFSGAQAYLYSWPIGSTTFAGGYSLPASGPVAVDTDRAYFATDVAEGSTITIQSAPLPDGGGVGGFPSFTTLASAQTTARGLSVGPTNLFWIANQGNTSVTEWLPKGGGAAKPVGVEASNLRFLAPDPSSPTIFWVGLPSSGFNQSAIVRASTSSGSIKGFVANLPSLGGIAVDATHVYWSQLDGRVFRAPKP